MAQQRKAQGTGEPPLNKVTKPARKSAEKATVKKAAPAAKKATAKKAAPAAKKTSGSRPPNRPGVRPANRKPGKSIVNQRQTPWTLIIVAAVLVLFAGGVVAYAVTRGGGDDSSTTNRYRLPEAAAAKAIKGVVYRQEPKHEHVTGTVKYDTSPPTGGNHNQYWAPNCGQVYDHQLANENAVHMLEHGAVWVTYNPATATKADIATLKNDVEGVVYTALTPYKGLKTPVSLQAWGYQLFVQKASDPRVEQFINALQANKNTTPELGISCKDPGFNAAQSTPGHPFNG